MVDAIIFVGILLAAIFTYLLWKLGNPLKWPEYFKTKTGMGILKGIVIAPTVILVLAFLLMLLPSKANAVWLNDASVYAGIDYTKKLSPMCDPNPVDSNGTSNLGVRLNIWQRGNIRVNSKYTHHSCVLGADNQQYDAIGIEVEWQVWKR